MVNLAKPRKVDESKKQLNKTQKIAGRKLELKTTFVDILAEFDSTICCDEKSYQSDNHAASNAVRQLLSSLQALLNRKNQESTWSNEQYDQLTHSTVKCINELNLLVSSESAFPEIVTLATLSIAFLLINYFTQFETKFSKHSSSISLPILASCHVYFSLLNEDVLLCKSIFDETFEAAVAEDSLDAIHSELNRLIALKTFDTTTLTFRDVAFLSGFLNCTAILDLCITKMVNVFIQIHLYIMKLCSLGMVNEFHVLRLLNQYLKAFLDYKHFIQEYCSAGKSSYSESLHKLITETIAQIDKNWESPITGVGNSVKQAYRYLIELIKEPMRSSVKLKQLVLDQYRLALRLPFTCKSKYRKLSMLIQSLATEDINLQEFELNIDSVTAKLCELPFYFEKNFAYQVIQHLSINSLSNSIADFYKSSILSLKDSYNDKSDESDKLTQRWSSHWLEAISEIFTPESSLSASTVVQNTLLAHILPFTLQNVPHSMSLLLSAFSQCSYAQISIVRIVLEKTSLQQSNSAFDQLPPRSWLMTMLDDADDMTRAEGLALLVDEKFIHRNRGLVCQLVLRFIQTNLNIDNASFRQRIICKLEQFYSKLVISICDRHISNSTNNLNDLNSVDREVVHFVKNSLDLLTLSLFPGSCFQRKFTALNVLSSIISILDKDDKKLVFIHFFRQISSQVPWHELILLGLVDKDDKIRRLTTEISIQFSKSPLSQYFELSGKSLNFDSIYLLAEKFLKSPRHQESHIGGLLLKCLFRSHLLQLSAFKNEPQPGLHLICTWIDKAHDLFYSEQFRANLLLASKCEPLHGHFLALNHCLSFASFSDAVLSQNTNCEAILSDGKLRSKVFEPVLKLSLDCLDYFLKLLTPNENVIDDQLNGEDIFEENLCSPSFFEMCQSIEDIIRQHSAKASSVSVEKASNQHDVFLSNDFQLILSMCWLNIKENCFLLTTLTSLFADLLSIIGEAPQIQAHIDDSVDYYLISGPELFQIGSKIVSVMLRCRHKGVIEASGVSLTKFMRTILRIQCLLNSSKHSKMRQSFRQSFEAFIREILDIIDFRTTAGSSVTRRSAGLALIMQAVLVGEAEAIYLDGIRPITDEANQNVTLYDRVVALLVSIATSPVVDDADHQFTDLPQSNALHVLRTIIDTSVLSHLSSKTVEQLFPLCVVGFTSSLWQIRNGSLQLFGGCITRMLGQKKRLKTTNTDFGNELGTTITFDEFAARYPTLIGVIIEQFATCSTSQEQLHAELVPVLSLLASFTPLIQNDGEMNSSKLQLVQFLIGFLSNRIWKIRMLAARSLANLWPLIKLESFIAEWCNADSTQINCNFLHGLLCCVSNLFELKQFIGSENIHEYRDKYRVMFETHLTSKQCTILTELCPAIFQSNQEQEEISSEDDEPAAAIIEECNQQMESIKTLSWTLTKVKENVNFKKSDDIRHKAALDLQLIINSILIKQQPNEFSQLVHEENLTIFVDILLILLEDEERAVRIIGQRIVTHLCRDSESSTSLKECFANKSRTLNQNVAIDKLISWLSTNYESETHLAQSLLTRLIQSANLDEYLVLFSRDRIYSEEWEFILFEREEKNVFAEPYMTSYRLFPYLESVMNKSCDIVANFISNNSLIADVVICCQQLRRILSQHKGNKLDSLMLLSIWKLPDFFSRLVNLFLILSLLERYNLCGNEKDIIESTLYSLKESFPIISSIQTHLYKIDDTLTQL